MTHPHIKKILDFLRAVSGRQPWTVYELAEEYQVSAKTIRRYLDDIIEAGIEVTYRNGPHGIKYYKITRKSIINYFKAK